RAQHHQRAVEVQPAFRVGDRDDQLIVPILLHNQKIGEIAAKRSEGDWEAREQAMLAEIAAQVALALENARLLDEARQRAIHERTVGEVVSHIGAAHDMDAVLRVAAQEIGKALGDSEVVVQIRAEELEAK
ncbi:MAG: GAF domain-containing protein, partial [Anaerolineales bacterium]|nr:GAF domain-containing protein [Anaerolineales bacterium]